MKIKVGIIFGGFSKEREISFAGGRTVYDNLNKSLFEPVPVFVDSFGNFVLLNWEFIYKGSIRDFYPPVEFIPASAGEYQIYAESLGNLSPEKQNDLINKIGKKIEPGDLKFMFDFAFLALHGPYGEDGKIQGLLEYLEIPYSGSGILPSAIGIDKVLQKKLMANAGFPGPEFVSIDREDWFSSNNNSNKKRQDKYKEVKNKFGFPVVVKSATQGSSIGISILNEDNQEAFEKAVNKSFFSYLLTQSEWILYDKEQKIEFIRNLVDIREGIGIPVNLISQSSEGKSKIVIYHPDDLLTEIEKHFSFFEQGGNGSLSLVYPDARGREGRGEVFLESLDGESEVLIESFVEGREFSCIVIQDEENKAIALPPTEIKKGKELFDYRSKYLPGLSRKITPIDLPPELINKIRQECERLFYELHFDVYARIDGFIKKDGTVFLNDPNTTSGMMPSSFFFHQAAEIGLNPSQFLTYIIRTSLQQRIVNSKNSGAFNSLLSKLDDSIKTDQLTVSKKIKVAVLLGGYSSERHISVESGRNIYEKLASSAKYEPIPVFLTGDEHEHIMYQIPINVLLKDNADDIKEKTEHYQVHEIVKEIIKNCSTITNKYSGVNNLEKPKRISYEDLSSMVDAVFIALHGRPGEDGAVQQNLERVGLAYNGSGIESSQLTIDKFRTNELLRQNGFNVAEHLLVFENDWNNDKAKIIETISRQITFPFIAKPVDDGCSSAVRKIKSIEELEAFAQLIFRKTTELNQENAKTLHIKAKEEFPQKNMFLVEELISKKQAHRFLEITGGMLTKYDENGDVLYEVFEASEALSEGEVLSLEEKFLAGQGQNITPARYSDDPAERQAISNKVKVIFGEAAKLLNINGYTRIDAFVRIYDVENVEVIFIESNSLPGMTPATCIFHQSAINGYKPYEFIDKILDFAFQKKKNTSKRSLEL